VHGSVVLVVAIGTSADEVATAFEGRCPVVRASSMDEAVELAGDLASPGDTVLLSPGCTSLDWYENYGERGDHFARLVRERTDRDSSS
jgi:UDP-N-acetylmuramoylalanine--D-glutamate ligase